jgi:hypothetical protein
MIRGFVFVFAYLLHYMFGIGNGENMKGFCLSAIGGQVLVYIYK